MQTSIKITARFTFAFAPLALVASACVVAPDGDSAPEALGESAERLSTLPLHAGVGTIGAQVTSNTTKQVGIGFNPSFGATPIALLTPLGGPYVDTFAVSTTGVIMSGFDVNARRVDDAQGAGWGQTLQVGWLGIVPIKQTHVQAGTRSAGDSATGGVRNVAITFPQSFGVTPRVVVTVHGWPNLDTFVVTTAGVTTSGFSANIWRADWDGGSWGQDLRLDWLAWDAADDLATAGATTGTADIGTSSTSFKSSSVLFPSAFSTAPTVIITPRGESVSDTFAVTARGVTTSGFDANFVRLDQRTGWGQQLKADWIALPAQ
ncbi:MAG: H-type lectin domain-containing protein [Minicystis sp.]